MLLKKQFHVVPNRFALAKLFTILLQQCSSSESEQSTLQTLLHLVTKTSSPLKVLESNTSSQHKVHDTEPCLVFVGWYHPWWHLSRKRSPRNPETSSLGQGNWPTSCLWKFMVKQNLKSVWTPTCSYGHLDICMWFQLNNLQNFSEQRSPQTFGCLCIAFIHFPQQFSCMFRKTKKLHECRGIKIAAASIPPEPRDLIQNTNCANMQSWIPFTAPKVEPARCFELAGKWGRMCYVAFNLIPTRLVGWLNVLLKENLRRLPALPLLVTCKPMGVPRWGWFSQQKMKNVSSLYKYYKWSCMHVVPEGERKTAIHIPRTWFFQVGKTPYTHLQCKSTCACGRQLQRGAWWAGLYWNFPGTSKWSFTSSSCSRREGAADFFQIKFQIVEKFLGNNWKQIQFSKNSLLLRR